jgi:predicted AAA+ superfamily ATPase
MECGLTYWRDGKYVVDFVNERGKDIWAIEVKSGGTGDAKGLERFRAKYPEARTLMIGGPGIPLEEFFSVPAGRWVG